MLIAEKNINKLKLKLKFLASINKRLEGNLTIQIFPKTNLINKYLYVFLCKPRIFRATEGLHPCEISENLFSKSIII